MVTDEDLGIMRTVQIGVSHGGMQILSSTGLICRGSIGAVD
jgi:hypothetical protein